jgi:nicotinate phosphoribosyltransferase
VTLIAPDPSLGLLTDLYQLTMASGYLKAGLAERESVFHLFYRRNPFGGGYCVACGLAQALELLERFRFSGDDLAYLSGLEGNDGKALFDAGFLAYLEGLELACDIDAVPEGTVVFPNEPLLRIVGPAAHCQILETPLLTLINFQTLIATKASRVCRAARGDAVIEFGLRRAQGPDGGLSASRAAYVGGCAGTSNVLAGKLFDIPVMGTHAHSWVSSFPSERAAFAAYARALPNNCTFLVDTYDTLTGVKNAIEAGRSLRERGHRMAGIRLDSGDLLSLSREARRLLDEAGFGEASIVASNDLDEHRIAELEDGGARIDVWGVGTRLATAFDEPALGGVYKLSAYRENGEWRPVLKLSEEAVKTYNPGVQQVRRFAGPQGFRVDVVYDETIGLSDPCVWVDAAGVEHPVPDGSDSEDLLVPVVRRGRSVAALAAIAEVRERALAQVERLPENVRRLREPEVYPVGLDRRLHRLKRRLMDQAREEVEEAREGLDHDAPL